MRKKTSLTIVERAIIAVPGFEGVAKKLGQQVALRGQSKSTLEKYIRRIALISLHFNRLPHQIEEDEINDYLVGLARDPKSPSRSSFKPYGLRLALLLPPFRDEQKSHCPAITKKGHQTSGHP